MHYTKLNLIILFINCFFFARGQSTEFYFNNEPCEALSTELNWYCVKSNLSISECKPAIKNFKDEENDIEGNFIWVNDNVELIIGTDQKLNLNDVMVHLPSTSTINHGESVQISEDFSLESRISRNEEEIYSIYLRDNQTSTLREVIRNCQSMDKVNSYFGCGRYPFQVIFITDIDLDGHSEILLTAEKEGSVLRILIGNIDGEYQVLKWLE